MRKPNTAAIRRQMKELERQIETLASVSSPGKALRLGRAADLLIEARGVDLHRLR
jgi:hypothetical protein